MDSYTFGGSKIKRFKAIMFRLSYITLLKTKTIALSLYIWLKAMSNKSLRKSMGLYRDSEKKTIHVSRIIPLDKWYIRVEFIVDRFDKRCVHLYSESGSYNDFLMAYKKGDEVSMPIDNILIAIAGMEGSWKKFN